MKKRDFLLCGFTGLCLEVFWTGSLNFIHNDPKMTASTSLLMFPIYSMGAFIKPISSLLANNSMFFRGSVYALLIYAVEFASGTVLKSLNICPWSYDHVKYNINGLIRLDYAPAWFTVGLLFEKLLNSTNS